MNSQPNPQAPLPHDLQDEDEISLLDLLEAVTDNLRLLVLVPLLIGIASLGITSYVPPTYQAKTTLLPPGSDGGGATAALAGQFGGLASLAGVSLGGGKTALPMSILNSDTLRDQVLTEYRLVEKWKSKTREEARKKLSKLLVAAEDKKSGVITITMKDEDPAFAATVANRVVQLLQAALDDLHLKNAREQRKFLEEQIESITRRPAQSPVVRDLMVQTMLRQFEAEKLKEAGGGRQQLVVVDPAQVPELKAGPKRALIAIISTLATGFLLLLGVFVARAVRNSSNDPESAQKMLSIKNGLRRTFGLKPKAPASN